MPSCAVVRRSSQMLAVPFLRRWLSTCGIVTFSTRNFTVSLVDAFVYRRVPCSPCSAVLRHRLRRDRGESKCCRQCNKPLVCASHGLSPCTIHVGFPSRADSLRPKHARILSPASGDLNCTKGKVGPYVSVGG